MRIHPLLRASLAAAAFTSLTASAAGANILIAVDKNAQQMTVTVDGAPRYNFTVSTGRAGYGTPNGVYHPQRLERTWFSKEYYNSPMPHSIFFRGGYAIHGSYEINALGGPASHGCIRLHPQNAAQLYALVQQEGMGATTIVVSGENPSGAVARRRAPAEDVYRTGPETPAYYGQRYQPYYYERSPGFTYQQPRGYYRYPNAPY
jgi:lipoprotein-anchoring transpeptidase ErfK/SrfK